ncbi:hypothetical protein [Streptomyces sp. NPDC059455]|uniref:hypothetical protein n=1 Tax=Streptomyces sp. NPDC059455 TaxID=3346837 RepID=UPI0036ADA2B4
MDASLGRYDVPGPWQTFEPPSPIDQTTDVGRATAVTDTPGTDAVADAFRHAPRSNHSHVGKVTSCCSAGLALISGEGSRS